MQILDYSIDKTPSIHLKTTILEGYIHQVFDSLDIEKNSISD